MTAAKRLAPLMSSERHDWCTPSDVLDVVRSFGPIALDPCSNANSVVGAQRSLCGTGPEDDGLVADWTAFDGLVYVNPPYGRELAKWIAKCAWEARTGAEIIALIPARPDTKVWQDDIFPAANAICFWRGRITFCGAPAPAPFPTALVYWGPRKFAFGAAFSAHGRVVFP